MGLTQFVKISKQRGRVVCNTPRVSIRNNGVMCLNAKAVEDFGFQRGDVIALGSDADTGEIGIKKSDDERGYVMTKIANSLNVNAKRLFEHLGIDPATVKGQYIPILKDGYLTIKLGENLEAVKNLPPKDE